MFCKKCGKELEENSVFCSNCGYQMAATTETVSPKGKSETKINENIITKNIIAIGITFFSFVIQIGIFYLMMNFEFCEDFFENLAPLFASILLQIFFIVILFVRGKFRSETFGKVFTGISVAMAAVSVIIYLFVNMVLSFWLFVFACEFAVGALLFFKIKLKENNKSNIPILIVCAVSVVLSFIIPTISIYPKYQRLDSNILDAYNSYSFWNAGIIKANSKVNKSLEYSNSDVYQQYIKPTLGKASPYSDDYSYGNYNNDRWELQYVYLNNYELSVPESFKAEFAISDYCNKEEAMEPVFNFFTFSDSGEYRIPQDYFSYSTYLGTYDEYLTEALQLYTNLTKQEAKEIVETITGANFIYQFAEETSEMSNGMQTKLLTYDVTRCYSSSNDKQYNGFTGNVRINYYPETGRLFVGFIFGEDDSIILQFADRLS